MPFDSVMSSFDLNPANVIVVNPLTQLGISPVPRCVAEHHKAKVLAAYRERGPLAIDLLDTGRVGWTERRIFNHDSVGRRRTDRKYFRSQLERSAGRYTLDVSYPPKPLIALAMTVHRALPNAVFSVEYFDTDPILNVSYTDPLDVDHRDCLGIWNEGEVVAIAEQAPRPGWWVRLFDLRQPFG